MKKFYLLGLLLFAFLCVPANADAQAYKSVAKVIKTISKTAKKTEKVKAKPKPKKPQTDNTATQAIAGQAAKESRKRNAQKQTICTTCNGKGYKNGVKCSNCNGSGKKMRTSRK